VKVYLSIFTLKKQGQFRYTLNVRIFSPYELTHLARHELTEVQAQHFGEMPVEYITGHVTFANLDFKVTPDVLIPRVETEELIALASSLCLDISSKPKLQPLQSLHIADVGTGSGAIAIGLAKLLGKNGQNFVMTLSDISGPALKIATENWERLLPSDIAVFIKSDLLQQYPPGEKFHLMIANLPYIPSERIRSLSPSVIEYEPHLALDGGPEGLTLISLFLEQAITQLLPEGKILLEMDYTHAAEILTLHSAWAGLVVSDSFGQPRFAVLSRKNK